MTYSVPTRRSSVLPDVDRGEGARRPRRAQQLAGDDAAQPCAARKLDGRDFGRSDALIAAGRHLVLGGQIDPELHHLERAAGFAERRGMIFLMDDPNRGGHPLAVNGSASGRERVCKYVSISVVALYSNKTPNTTQKKIIRHRG